MCSDVSQGGLPSGRDLRKLGPSSRSVHSQCPPANSPQDSLREEFHRYWGQKGLWTVRQGWSSGSAWDCWCPSRRQQADQKSSYGWVSFAHLGGAREEDASKLLHQWQLDPQKSCLTIHYRMRGQAHQAQEGLLDCVGWRKSQDSTHAHFRSASDWTRRHFCWKGIGHCEASRGFSKGSFKQEAWCHGQEQRLPQFPQAIEAVHSS